MRYGLREYIGAEHNNIFVTVFIMEVELNLVVYEEVLKETGVSIKLSKLI